MADKSQHPLPRLALLGAAVCLAALLGSTKASAQDRTGYITGEPKGLEMIVHIIGEVQRPGEYRVPDQTDVLQLLSKAGGPSQYARLRSVSVRRMAVNRPAASLQGAGAPRVEFLQVNVEGILRNQDMTPPPVLQPGDIVFVPKSSSGRWRNISAVIRDVSVVVSAYYLYELARRR